MRLSALVLAAVADTAVLARCDSAPKPDADGRYTISAPGIMAQFIPYGATLTNLFVKDKNGEDIDVVLGYDDVDYYPVDPGHPVYNAIPGRYAGRIGKAQYTIDGVTYETERNDGENTLHSGTNNWSFRFWNVTAYTADSITFSLLDESESSKGFPGRVEANVTYSVTNNTWHIKMTAHSLDNKTPILLTQHTYFNLDAYRNPATALIWNHTLALPYSPRYLEADDAALPTGKILTAAANSINDFHSAGYEGRLLGHSRHLPQFAGNCGAGGMCEGYNGYWLFDDMPETKNVEERPVAVVLSSEFSGVKAELRTDQPGVVVYTCNWMNGSAKLKSTQGLEGRDTVERSSCIAIEAQEWPDGINHPEWGRLEKQIFGPGQTYSWESSWTFSVL